jgi:hypothetical protein
VTVPTRRSSKPDFEIRVVGPGIRPMGVSVRALSRILNAVQRLIERTEEEEPEGEEKERVESASPLHLVKIASGSARYGVLSDTADTALATIEDAGKFLRDPAHSEWEPEVLSPIQRLSEVAKSLQGDIEFRRPGKEGELLATITSRSYDEMSREAFVTGDSTISGYLERVGGATSYFCGLRLPEQPSRMLICPVESESLVRQLGQHVFENVRVFGTVTWFRRNWRVRKIYVKSFEQPKEGSILEALNRVYEAGGKAWDDVEDVEGFISEMRKG